MAEQCDPDAEASPAPNEVHQATDLEGAAEKLHRNGSRGKIPEHLYDDIRKTANRKRRVKSKQNKRAKKEQLRQQEEGALDGVDEEERGRLAAEKAAREQELSAARVKTHLEQMAKVEAALESGMRVAVDCSYAFMCSPKEMRSLSKQLEMSAGYNKRAAAPLSLSYTSFSGPLADFAATMGCPGWKARLLPQPLLEAFPSAQVVVLSPDAEEPLLQLQRGEVYCIGGLVDRTVQKNVTLKFAEERQIAARRLPVQEFAAQLGLGPGTCRKPVLNVNDVVLALLEFNASGDWVKALDVAIPGRKRRPSGSSCGAPPTSRPEQATTGETAIAQAGTLPAATDQASTAQTASCAAACGRAASEQAGTQRAASCPAASDQAIAEHAGTEQAVT